MDLVTGEAEGYAHSQRQIRKRQSALDLKPIAQELAALITERKEDARLRWSKAGRVRPRLDKVLPPAAQQTTEGRRKRLRQELEERLRPVGWKLGSGGWWEAG